MMDLRRPPRGGIQSAPAYSLLDLPYAPYHQYADKPKDWYINTARLRCGYPPKLKPEEQEYHKALQYSHSVECLGSENPLEANVKIPGGEEGLNVRNLQSEWKPLAVGVKIQHPSVSMEPLPSISWKNNLVHFNYQLCSVARHTQESKDVVTMGTLLLWCHLTLGMIPCSLLKCDWENCI